MEKIRLPRGEKLTLADAQGHIRDYQKWNSAVLHLYDKLTTGPHDELRAEDMLSVHALNGYNRRESSMEAMTALWERKKELQATITPITKKQLEDLAADEQAVTAKMVGNAIWQLVNLRIGFGQVAATKCLRQLRPNVIPIYDRKVASWYSHLEDASWTKWVRAIYADVVKNQTSLTALQADLDFKLPLLRIWDILLWQSAQ